MFVALSAYDTLYRVVSDDRAARLGKPLESKDSPCQSGESENSPWQALFTNANVQVVGSHLPCIPYRGMAIEQVYLSPDMREKTGGNTLPLACRIHNFDQATAIVGHKSEE